MYMIVGFIVTFQLLRLRDYDNAIDELAWRLKDRR